MPDERDDPLIERAARDLARAPRPDEESVERVLSSVRALPTPRRDSLLSRLARSSVERSLAISPIVGALAAALLVVVGVLAGTRMDRARPPEGIAQPGTERVVQFLLAAPNAATVSLVGDFNDWDIAATPMRRQRPGGGGMWVAELILPPGRHVYSFVIDGSRWTPDPLAPRAAEDGFGTPSSVLVVDGGPST